MNMFSVFLASGCIPFIAQAAAANTDEAFTLWQILHKGGPVMYVLGLLSIIALALILFFIFTLSARVITSARYMQTASTLIKRRDYLGLLALSGKQNNLAVARIVERAVNFMTENPTAAFTEVREIAQAEGVRTASQMNQRIAYLADVGTIAPMLGLLGTVAGMIQAFSVVANGMDASRPMMLATGVAEALVTTATGLVIAIPAMAFYSYFRGRVQALVSELEAASTQLLAMLSANCDSKGNTDTDKDK